MTNRIYLSNIPGFYDIFNNNNDNKSTYTLNLSKLTCKTENNEYYNIIRYNKDFLRSCDVYTYGLARSIILNSENKVVCFSPPKSISSDNFITKYPSKNDNIIAMEFVEGTMINVFWNSKIGLVGDWEITTRNTVGARSRFYKSNKHRSKTFREMFLEAALENNLDINNLEKEKCYSFVLQHPENRIVVPFKKPQLYLVAVYSIKEIKEEFYVDFLNVYEHVYYFLDKFNTTVKFPKFYEYKDYSELIDKYASMNTPYDILGVVLYNNMTHERTKIRNPVYEEIRSLKGNEPKIQYHYLCLRKEGKVSEYLKFYPENKSDFSDFRDQVHLFTNTLYSNYVSCYIKKEKPLNQFSDQFKTHMYNIHQSFIHGLKEKNLFVTNTVVIKYVNNLHPSLLMYCLNFNMRKRNIDFVKADTEI